MREGLTRADAWKEARRRARSAGTAAFLIGMSGYVIEERYFGGQGGGWHALDLRGRERQDQEGLDAVEEEEMGRGRQRGSVPYRGRGSGCPDGQRRAEARE